MLEMPAKRPLWVYVTAVIIAWIIILGGTWFWDIARFDIFAIFCGGFFIGMITMYIAAHIYQWH